MLIAHYRIGSATTTHEGRHFAALETLFAHTGDDEEVPGIFHPAHGVPPSHIETPEPLEADPGPVEYDDVLGE